MSSSTGKYYTKSTKTNKLLTVLHCELVKMPVRHTKRQKRNISGLRNQPKPIFEPSPTEATATKPSSDIPAQPNPDHEDEDEDLGLRCLDSLKLLWRADDEEESTEEEDPKNREDEFDEWDGQQEFGEESLYIKLMTLAIDSGDDPRDDDWVPEGLRRRKGIKKGHLHCEV